MGCPQSKGKREKSPEEGKKEEEETATPQDEGAQGENEVCVDNEDATKEDEKVGVIKRERK